MTKDEALKMAIEAMQSAYSSHGKILPSYPAQDAWMFYGCDEKLSKSLQACKEALEQPAQEPVAWLYKRENSSGGWYVVTNYEKEHDNGTRNIQCYDIPLYTHPAPSCEPLSEDAIEGLAKFIPKDDFVYDLVRAVEKYHGIGIKK